MSVSKRLSGMGFSMFAQKPRITRLPAVDVPLPPGKQGTVKLRIDPGATADRASLDALEREARALAPPAPSAATALEAQGAAGLSGLERQRQADFDRARTALDGSLSGTTAAVSAGQLPQAELDAYRNPFLGRVLSVLQRNSDASKASARAKAAAAGAFGGSRLDETLEGLDEALLRQQGLAAFDAEGAAQQAFAADRDAALKAALANQQAAAGDLDRRSGAVGDAIALAERAAGSARADASAQFDAGLAQRRQADSSAGAGFDGELDRIAALRALVQARPDGATRAEVTMPAPRGQEAALLEAVRALLQGQSPAPAPSVASGGRAR